MVNNVNRPNPFFAAATTYSSSTGFTIAKTSRTDFFNNEIRKMTFTWSSPKPRVMTNIDRFISSLSFEWNNDLNSADVTVVYSEDDSIPNSERAQQLATIGTFDLFTIVRPGAGSASSRTIFLDSDTRIKSGGSFNVNIIGSPVSLIDLRAIWDGSSNPTVNIRYNRLAGATTQVLAPANQSYQLTPGQTIEDVGAEFTVVNPDGATTFRWRRKTSFGGPFTAPGVITGNVEQPDYTAPPSNRISSDNADSTEVWTVTAENNDVSDSYEVSFRVVKTAPPEPPSDPIPSIPSRPTLASRTTSQLVFTTNAVTGATTYRWRISSDNRITDLDVIRTTTTPRLVISGLSGGQSRWVDVRAENTSGNSNYSAAGTGTTRTPTPANINIRATENLRLSSSVRVIVVEQNEIDITASDEISFSALVTVSLSASSTINISVTDELRLSSLITIGLIRAFIPTELIIGSSQYSKIYIGNTEYKKAYVGNTLVFENR